VLDQQFARLSELEREILVWLAIEREAITVQTLRGNLMHAVTPPELLGALSALQARSLLEKAGDGLTLQNVVIEYCTERLVEGVCAEIGEEADVGPWLNRFALLKAEAKEYVRQSQERLILQPIIDCLLRKMGKARLVERLQIIIPTLRIQARASERGYVGGNILNLLLRLKIDVSGHDFSGISVWQAYLPESSLNHVNLAYADLTGSAFAKPFNTIWSVAYSPDNRILAGGSLVGPIFIWRTEDGQALDVYQGHTSVVYSMAFSPDNTLLASASQDQTLRLWDVRSGQTQLILFRDQIGCTNSVAFSPDGALLASGHDDCMGRLWCVATGELVATLRGHTERVTDLVFGADGKTLASCSHDQTIRIWDVASGALLQTLQEQTNLEAIAFDSRKRCVVSTGSRGPRFWQIATGECHEAPRLHEDGIHRVVFSPNYDLVASTSHDRAVRIWDARTYAPLHVMQGHRDEVTGLAFSPDGQRVVSASADRTVCQWDVQSGALLQVFNGFSGRVDALGFAASGELMVFSVQHGQVRVWQARGSASHQLLSGSSDLQRPLALSPDRPLLICGDTNGTAYIWDWQQGHLHWKLEDHAKRITAVAAGGWLFATGNREEGIRIWDAHVHRISHSFPVENTILWSLAFSPDQALLAAGTDNHILAWELAQRRLLHKITLSGHAPVCHTLNFRKDGTLLAGGCGDCTIQVWDIVTGETLHILREHKGAIFALAFSPDGRLLAAGCGDRHVYLWDVEQGVLLYRLAGHEGWVLKVAFVGEGNTLATGSYDGIVKLWDVHTGTCLGTFKPSGPYVGMNISGVTGISAAQIEALKALGAFEEKQ